MSKLLFRGQLLERNVSAELTERIHGTDIVPYYPLMKLLERRRKDLTTVEYLERSEGLSTSGVLLCIRCARDCIWAAGENTLNQTKDRRDLARPDAYAWNTI